MPSAKDLPFPPHWINAYIFDKLSEYDDIGMDKTQQLVPIFATTPTNTEELYRNMIQTTTIEEPLIIQYDRLMRFRQSPFYGIKKEQLIYYLYSTNIANVNNANIVISQLLDREDAAAQDLNVWAKDNPIMLNGDQVNSNVFFHNIKVYQADETRDVLELASARTVFINKIIIEYDYHVKWVDAERNPSTGAITNPDKQQEEFK
jgi:hypothetical protein